MEKLARGATQAVLFTDKRRGYLSYQDQFIDAWCQETAKW